MRRLNQALVHKYVYFFCLFVQNFWAVIQKIFTCLFGDENEQYSSIVIGVKKSYFPLIRCRAYQALIEHFVIGQFVVAQFNKPITFKVVV